MLNVYAWQECPHCHATVEWLKKHHIPFTYHEIEECPSAEIAKVVEVNGGDDWVVPTLEFNGQWRPGEIFNADKLEHDLRMMGVVKD